MKVSVIIPVYNVERYLARCLDSVLTAAEGYEVEVICVNDGSPDGSAAILERYADRVRVITKENGGLGSARNAGMAVASGDYVMFVDSDDFIPVNAIGEFVRAAEATGAPLVVSSSVVKDVDLRGGRLPSCGPARHFVRPRDWIVGRKVQYSAWNKFYRRDLVANRPFPKGLYEDFSWTTSVFCDLESFAVVDAPLYVYCLNAGAVSIVRSAYSDRKTVDSMAAIARVLDYAKGKGAWKFALRQAADGLSSTIGQVYKAVRRGGGPELVRTMRERLGEIVARYPEVMRRLSLKARYRLWRLRHK